jgi:hypothetical protein
MNYCCLRGGAEDAAVAVFVEQGDLFPFIIENEMYKVFYAPQVGVKYTKKAFEKYFFIVEEW